MRPQWYDFPHLTFRPRDTSSGGRGGGGRGTISGGRGFASGGLGEGANGGGRGANDKGSGGGVSTGVKHLPAQHGEQQTYDKKNRQSFRGQGHLKSQFCLQTTDPCPEKAKNKEAELEFLRLHPGCKARFIITAHSGGLANVHTSDFEETFQCRDEAGLQIALDLFAKVEQETGVFASRGFFDKDQFDKAQMIHLTSATRDVNPSKEKDGA